MTTDPTAAAGALAPADAAWLADRTAELHDIHRRTAEGIIRTGQILAAVKHRIGHGHFTQWVESTQPFSYQLANKFMQVYENFGDIDNSKLYRFDATALYQLAQPSTDPAVREHALAVADSGPVTYSMVREWLAPPDKEPRPSDWRQVRSDDLPAMRPVLRVALRMAGVRTAGQLAERLDVGDTLGLDPGGVAGLRLALRLAQGLGPAPPCPACGGSGFPAAGG